MTASRPCGPTTRSSHLCATPTTALVPPTTTPSAAARCGPVHSGDGYGPLIVVALGRTCWVLEVNLLVPRNRCNTSPATMSLQSWWDSARAAFCTGLLSYCGFVSRARPNRWLRPRAHCAVRAVLRSFPLFLLRPHVLTLALGCVQSRSGDCRDPTFEHYTAKPYVIGLQDTLFGCGDRVHDFYHVEPQHTCLLDAQANLVVDWIVRYAPQGPAQ